MNAGREEEGDAERTSATECPGSTVLRLSLVKEGNIKVERHRKRVKIGATVVYVCEENGTQYRSMEYM